MVQILSSVLLITTLLASNTVFAKPKPYINGWHKVLVNGQHVGYLIQQYSFDKSTKKQIAKNFIRIILPNQDITRSLKAEATEKFSPLSFQYTEKVNNNTRLNDGEFSKGVMTVAVTKNGAGQTPVQLKLPDKDTILGIFLYHLIVTNKAGMKTGNHFAYAAVAEDSATAHVGTVDVKEMKKIDGLDTFQLLNVFNNNKTIEYITPTGQIVRTKDPFTGVETRLVTTQKEAVGGISFPKKTVEILFGSVPGESFPKPNTAKKIGPNQKSPLPKGVAPPPGKGK